MTLDKIVKVIKTELKKRELKITEEDGSDSECYKTIIIINRRGKHIVIDVWYDKSVSIISCACIDMIFELDSDGEETLKFTLGQSLDEIEGTE